MFSLVALASKGPDRISAELDLDEMEELISSDGFTIWKSPCRCGDYYSITEMQLDDGQDTVQCPSCSLVIRVLYSPLDTQQSI
jgi:diphthamide biosynthesis protein 3